MKGFKRSIIGIVILALIGGYYYFYEIKYRGQKEKEKEISEKIYPLEKSDIQKIIYQREKEKIVLEKKNGKWVITEPVKAEVDKKTVTSLVDTFAKLKTFRKLKDVNIDDPDFGFKKNPLKVTLIDKKGKTYTAIFGHQNPTNSYVYTLKGKGKDVLLVWLYPKKLLKETLFDLRFKKVLPLKPEQVTRILYVKGATSVEIKKIKDHEWKILSPIQAKGDRYAIEGFVSSVADGKVVRFLDTPPKDDTKFGWTSPRMTITFHFVPKNRKTEKGDKANETAPKNTKEKSVKILIGKDRDEKHLYVKIADQPTVMILKKDYLKDLDKKVFDFRDKNVWDYEIDDVIHVKYENPEKHLIIEAKKDLKKEVWNLVKPEKTRADTRAIESWLWDLSALRAKKFLTEEEFENLKGTSSQSFRRFEIGVKNAPPLVLKVYHVKDKWVAQREKSRWYYVLDPRDIEKTFTTVFTLKYRRIIKFEDTDVGKVIIKTGDKKFFFVKEKNLWYKKTGDTKKKIPNIDVLNVLWELSDLKYTKMQDKLSTALTPNKWTKITLFADDEKMLGKVSFQPTKDGKFVVFKNERKKKFFLVEKKHAEKFNQAYEKLIQEKNTEEE